MSGQEELAGIGSPLEIATPDEMHDFGRRIAGLLRAGDVVLLSGDLGAGKTTFTRGLGDALDVRGPVTSPTFVLARTHPSLSGGPALVHVDAYRLGSAVELDDLDIDFEHSVVVIEWGAGLVEVLTESYLAIDIDRPHGAAASTESAGAGRASAESGDSERPLDPGDPGDFDEVEEPIEPRTVQLRGVGPRWT
ncbi:tRNA (adenosine(37)-N6)-threonylcarbamoyltransferase complex ATPase subunit type 1 TsaE [Herbiconiux daphne]|uniref:tRNA threonylcarbamoyladenosine biosynthesis protein TsaE n=1 Tax=Herbiconiux daphne TaxID=2970914 RepID=A0ABT2GZV1_9MICO|nr:tRNA (adenosine(37)-N6)-threonylcarbamoyltransferase complex ATPase subunit type 1 TsaE [Herbiconiux daphne]MCS5732610.1 tRNA (adenosine(37)-N6)-threonylcarbamoyltransferase complex ATPase subunit type 1 TsaE [Herbiconiux daphne]